MAQTKYYGLDFKVVAKQMIEMECDDLLSFINTVDSGLKHELTNFESFIDRITRGMDEAKRNETLEWYSDDAFGLMDRYPAILWQSVFISLYSFFELGMNDICRRVRRIASEKAIPKTAVANKSVVVLPAEKCLEEFKIRLAKKSPEWKKMIAFIGIRNLIVHNRGFLRKNDAESERVQAFIRHAAFISVDNRNRLRLEKSFCVDMLQVMRIVLHKTITAIPKRLFDS